MRLKAIWLITLVFGIVLAADWLPQLRGDIPSLLSKTGWVWPYGNPRWNWLIPCLIGVGIYLVGARIALHRPENGRYPVRLILWAYLGAALLPLLLMTLDGDPLFILFTRAASPLTGGYQYAAIMSTDSNRDLRRWPDFTEDYLAQVHIQPSGVALDPPGIFALYQANQTILEQTPPVANALDGWVRPQQCQNLYMMTWSSAEMSSAWLQMFMPLWASLVVAPLYKLGKLLFNEKQARMAVILWPLVPGVSIFAPRFNTFYPLITLVMLLLLWEGMKRNQVAKIVLGGFVLSVGMFFNLSLVPLGLLAGLLIIGFRLHNWERLTADLVFFGGGCVSAWIVFWALSGIAPDTLIRHSMSAHSKLDRPYVPWMVVHTYDMFLFVGLPLAFLAIWRITQLRRANKNGDLLAGAAFLTLVILVLSGTARGETGRVWLFFAPIWVLLAADFLITRKSYERFLTLIIQAGILLIMAAFLRATFTSLTVPPTPPTATPAMFPMDSHFQQGSDQVTLTGVSIETAFDQITLMVVLPPDGSSYDSLNWNPLGWNYPPSCWKSGQVFDDIVQIPLGDPPISGGWLFSLSIHDMYTGEPMQVTNPDGQVSNQVGIGPVNTP